MSNTTPSDRHSAPSSNKGSTSINAGIDSAFTSNPGHRGSLTPDELDAIHQTNSFKQAAKLEKLDNRKLASKTKNLQPIKEPIKQ